MDKKILLAVLVIAGVLVFIYFLRMNQISSSGTNQASGVVNGGNQQTSGQISLDDDFEEPDDDNGGSGTAGGISNGNGNSSGDSGGVSGKVSLSELAAHNTKTNCWVAYGGKVYDITSFLPKHPGSSAAIEPYCGTGDEFTQAFTQKHGTKKVGALMRAGVLIGDFDVVGSQ